jgi:hypothetical protein
MDVHGDERGGRRLRLYECGRPTRSSGCESSSKILDMWDVGPVLFRDLELALNQYDLPQRSSCLH